MPSPGAGPYFPPPIISSHPPPSPPYFVFMRLPLTVSYNLPGRVTHGRRANLLRSDWTCLFSLPGQSSLPQRAESGRLRFSVLKCVLCNTVMICCLLSISFSKSKWCRDWDHTAEASEGVREASCWYSRSLRAGGPAAAHDDKECPVPLQENFKLRTSHFLQISWGILVHFRPLVESSVMF